MGTSIGNILVWASGGNRVTPASAKIAQGWQVGEQPACEYENERMYERDTKLNQIISYLDNGVPLSDLIAGSVVIGGTSSQIQIGNDTSYHALFSEEYFRTFLPDKTAYVGLEAEGRDSKNVDGSRVRFIREYSLDALDITWTSAGGGIYTTTDRIRFTHDFFSDEVFLGGQISMKLTGFDTIVFGTIQSATLRGYDSTSCEIGEFRIYSPVMPPATGSGVYSSSVVTFSLGRSASELTEL